MTIQTPEQVAAATYRTLSALPQKLSGGRLRDIMVKAIEADRAQRTPWPLQEGIRGVTNVISGEVYVSEDGEGALILHELEDGGTYIVGVSMFGQNLGETFTTSGTVESWETGWDA